MGEPALDELARHVSHRFGERLVQPVILGLRHQAVKAAGLGALVVPLAVAVTLGIATDLQRRLRERAVFDRRAEAVRLAVGRCRCVQAKDADNEAVLPWLAEHGVHWEALGNEPAARRMEIGVTQEFVPPPASGVQCQCAKPRCSRWRTWDQPGDKQRRRLDVECHAGGDHCLDVVVPNQPCL